MQNNVSLLSWGTGTSVTPGKRIPGKKRDMKPHAMSPPRKDTITNQDINRLITKQDPSLPPIIAKYHPVYKSLFNYARDPTGTDDDPNYSINNSRNEKEDSVNKLKVTNNKDNDDKYKK